MKNLSVLGKITFIIAIVFFAMGLILLFHEIRNSTFTLLQSHGVLFLALGIGLFFSALTNIKEQS